jgi:hypothetical protein
LLSSFGDAGAFLAPLQRHGLNVTALSERRFVNEHLVIYRVSAAAEEP